MDYSWGIIPIAIVMLVGGYAQRRSTLPKKDRYRILLIIDGGFIVSFAAAFCRAINAFHVAVFIALVFTLSVASVLIYRLEGRMSG